MIFGQGSFINDPNATPDQVAKKREAIAAMMGQYGKARTPTEGWMDLATGVMNGISDYKLGKMEQDRRAKADEAFSSVFGGPFGASDPTISTSGPRTHGADGSFGDPYGARNAAMAANGGPTRAAADAMNGLPPSLVQSESGGNWGALNSEGYGGRGQFGAERLADAARAGIIPAGMTGADYARAPREVQLAVENWHKQDILGDLGRYVGVDVDGPGPIPPLTENSILSVAHLGGTGGARKFIESGGAYNPADSNGTSLADYAAQHAGGTISTQGGMPSMPAYSGPSVQDLAQLAANPWLTPEQRSVVTAQLQQAQQATDPLRQLQLQEAQLRLEQARNPVTSRLLSADEATSMGLPAGGAYQIGRDGKVSTVVTPSKAGAGATEFGLTPQYITDPEGNLKMVQLGKDGSINEVKLPEGSAIQKGVEKLDLGTAFQWYNTITGEPIGDPIAKNNEQAAADTARGSATGKAQAESAQGAPAAIAKSESGIALINSIISDPNLDSITGMIQGRLPPMSQKGVDLNTKIEQLKGKSFLEAFESLKGGGQITEREGAAAQAAMARLDRAQSTPAYIEALVELRTIMETALSRAQGKSSGATAPAPSQPTRLRYNPATGELE